MQELSYYQKRALNFRMKKDRHYNCAQAIVLAFAERLGLDEEMLYEMTRNFGRGMKMYSVCGGITGGIIVLGFLGISDEGAVNRFYAKWRELHEGFMECGNFLDIADRERINERSFCNNLVIEGVKFLEQTLLDNGIDLETLKRIEMAA